MSRRAWFLIAPLALVLLLGAGLWGAWHFSPRWLPGVARHYAPRYGVELQVLELEAPRLNGVRVRRVALRRGNIEIDARDLSLAYDRTQLQAAGRLQALHAARLDLIVGPSPPGEPASPLPDPRTLWALVPVDSLGIDRLNLTVREPAVRLHGSVRMDAERIAARITADAPERVAGHQLSVLLQRDGRLAAALRTPAPAAALVADVDATWQGPIAVAVADPARLRAAPTTVSARLRAAATTVSARLRAAPAPEDAKALLAVWGIDTREVEVRGELRTRLPWPLPSFADPADALRFARTLEASGAVHVAWRGSRAGLLRDGHLRADATVVRTPHSVEVQLSPGMLFAGELELERPFVLLGQTIAPRVEIAPTGAARVRLANDVVEVQATVRGRLGTPRAGATLTLRDARVPLTVAGGTRFDGLRTAAKVDLTLPRTAFARLAAQADLTVEGSRHTLAMRVARGAHVELGRVGDWSRGTTHARAAAPIDVTLTPASLRWRTGRITADVRLPKGNFGGIDATIAPAQVQLLRVEGVAGARIDATGAPGTAVATHVTARGNTVPVQATGIVRLRGDATHSELALRIGRSALPVAFAVDYDLAHKRGRVQLAQTLRWSAPLFAGLLERWKQPGDSTRGALTADVTVDYRFVGAGTRVSARGTLDAQDVAGTWDDYRADDIDLRTAFTFADDTLRLDGGTLHVGEAFVGTALRNITSDFDYSPGARGSSLSSGVLHSSGVRTELLGGSVATGAFAYRLADGATDLDVTLEGLQLAQVLALQDEDIKGDGIIDGTLPVQVRGNVAEIQGGSVHARPPGGVIAYGKANEYAANIGQPGFQFAVAALSDFHYTKLESSIDYDRTSTLALGVKLYGHNPAVENGRPINYNLNVTQNLLDLLRSLRASDELTRRLEQKYQQR